MKSLAPNPWGLYQVHGNVWEFVQDCWNESYEGAPNDGSAWEAGKCNTRVRRGGSWDNAPWDLRSAFRFRISSDYRVEVIGFRLGSDCHRQN